MEDCATAAPAMRATTRRDLADMMLRRVSGSWSCKGEGEWMSEIDELRMDIWGSKKTKCEMIDGKERKRKYGRSETIVNGDAMGLRWLEKEEVASRQPQVACTQVRKSSSGLAGRQRRSQI
jgi:hypothetical protein